MTEADHAQPPDIAERVVLGALIDDGPEFQQLAMPALTMAAFTDPTHRAIFQAIHTLHRVGEDIDMPSVAQALRDGGVLESIGSGTLARIVTQAITVRSPRVHLQRIVEAAQTRELHDTMRQLLASGATADVVHEQLAALRNDRPDMSVTLPSIEDQIAGYHQELERRRDMDTPLVGMPTGWRDLDGEYNLDNPGASRTGYLPGGFERGHLIFVAARPGVGKTSIIIDFIRASCKNGNGVVFFSNEMPAQEIIELLVCAEVGIIKRDRYKWPKDLTPHHWDRIAEVEADIAENWNLVIDDQAKTIDDQRRTLAAARQKFRDSGCELDIMFQDFVQRMGTKGGRGQMAQHEEFGTFSKGMKDTAKEMDIAVVAAAQLNRGSLENDRLPRADDLRGSGDLEQDADVIMGLHRPYATGGEESGHPPTELQVVMLKVRHGAAGQVFERTFVGELAQTREAALRSLAATVQPPSPT